MGGTSVWHPLSLCNSPSGVPLAPSASAVSLCLCLVGIYGIRKNRLGPGSLEPRSSAGLGVSLLEAQSLAWGLHVKSPGGANKLLASKLGSVLNVLDKGPREVLCLLALTWHVVKPGSIPRNHPQAPHHKECSPNADQERPLSRWVWPSKKCLRSLRG